MSMNLIPYKNDEKIALELSDENVKMPTNFNRNEQEKFHAQLS